MTSRSLIRSGGEIASRFHGLDWLVMTVAIVSFQLILWLNLDILGLAPAVLFGLSGFVADTFVAAVVLAAWTVAAAFFARIPSSPGKEQLPAFKWRLPATGPR